MEKGPLDPRARTHPNVERALRAHSPHVQIDTVQLEERALAVLDSFDKKRCASPLLLRGATGQLASGTDCTCFLDRQTHPTAP